MSIRMTRLWARSATACLAARPDQGSFEDVRAALLREGAWTGELRQKTKGGEDVTVECRVQLEVVDGRRLVLESTRDISERKSWEARQQLLLRELTHRVKNTLAIVQSIASLTLRTTQSPADFVERFSARLEALSGAHGLLVQSDWRGADFASLARGQLAPYIADSPDRARLEGPSVILPADLATPFGLVLHELAANAVKYGSLSAPDGGVDVIWAVEPGNNSSLLKVQWREVNGPKVKAPAELGFGTRLIDMALQGATVTPRLPRRRLCLRHRAAVGACRFRRRMKMTFPLQGANVLIVEDDFLVALEVETVLQDEGAHVLPICRTVNEALAVARDPAALISVAILDVRLGREMVTPVARELAGKGDAVPVLHRSGEYGSDRRRVAAAPRSSRNRRRARLCSPPSPKAFRPPTEERAERAGSFEASQRSASLGARPSLCCPSPVDHGRSRNATDAPRTAMTRADVDVREEEAGSHAPLDLDDSLRRAAERGSGGLSPARWDSLLAAAMASHPLEIFGVCEPKRSGGPH